MDFVNIKDCAPPAGIEHFFNLRPKAMTYFKDYVKCPNLRLLAQKDASVLKDWVLLYQADYYDDYDKVEHTGLVLRKGDYTFVTISQYCDIRRVYYNDIWEV